MPYSEKHKAKLVEQETDYHQLMYDLRDEARSYEARKGEIIDDEAWDIEHLKALQQKEEDIRQQWIQKSKEIKQYENQHFWYPNDPEKRRPRKKNEVDPEDSLYHQNRFHVPVDSAKDQQHRLYCLAISKYIEELNQQHSDYIDSYEDMTWHDYSDKIKNRKSIENEIIQWKWLLRIYPKLPACITNSIAYGIPMGRRHLTLTHMVIILNLKWPQIRDDFTEEEKDAFDLVEYNEDGYPINRKGKISRRTVSLSVEQYRHKVSKMIENFIEDYAEYRDEDRPLSFQWGDISRNTERNYETRKTKPKEYKPFCKEPKIRNAYADKPETVSLCNATECLSKRYGMGSHARALAPLSDEHIFIANQNRVFNSSSGQYFSPQEFNLKHAKERKELTNKTNVLREMIVEELITQVDMGEFRPHTPTIRIIEKNENHRIGNTFVERVEAVAGDVSPFLNLLKKLLPEEQQQLRFLDRIAYMYQQRKKDKVAIWLGSEIQGNGKSELIKTCSYGLGEEYSKVFKRESIRHHRFSNYYMDKLFYVLDDLRAWNENDKERLYWETKRVADSEKLPIELKHENATFDYPIVGLVICTTNSREPIYLPSVDRNMEMFWTEAPPMTMEEQEEYRAWREVSYGHIKYFFQNTHVISKDFHAGMFPLETEWRQHLITHSIPEVEEIIIRQCKKNAPPFDKDLTTIDAVIESLVDTGITTGGVPPRNKVARAFEKLGFIKLKDKRLKSGKATLWAIENQTKWATAKESEIRKYYENQGV